MHFPIQTSSILIVATLMLCSALAAPAGDTRENIRLAKAALRAAENTNDAQVKATKLSEARTLIDQIKAADPGNAEVRTLESKYRYLAPDAPSASPSAAPAAAGAAGSPEALRDWVTIVEMNKDLRERTGRFFPNPENIAYSPDQTSAVLSLAADVLKNDRPRILEFLKSFSAKYGQPDDAMDRKIIALTPKDPKKGMYDEANQRPDDLPSQCYNGLVDRLTWVQENPAREAKIILRNAMLAVADAEFIMDTHRDAQYQRIEAELKRAQQFNPKDNEITSALSTVQASRKRSAADAKKALESARFPANAPGFAGPGAVPDLVAATRQYYSGAYPKEKILAVSVAGGWIVAKTNIFGQPIQWGLPVFCAAQQNEPGICRVFKMTVLTGIGAGIAKVPPFTDHWTGDSFRMLVANVK
jgi:hypothetical protein